MSSEEFQVSGQNSAAPFTLKLHRGDGMTLVAMNWKDGEPPQDFVGFAIEYKEPGGDEFFALKNRLNFPGPGGEVNPQTTSSLFYSLAFLYQTSGPIREAIKKVTQDDRIFVYGVSDRTVVGLDLQKPDGNVAPVRPAALGDNVPEPFKSEPAGGSGNRMHHKFVVIDFDKPTARVYLGSYNFSATADKENGENLLLIRDRRVAVSYVVEALRIFDHYHFRVAQEEAATGARKELVLATPPRNPGEEPWWAEEYTVAQKIRGRELFA